MTDSAKTADVLGIGISLHDRGELIALVRESVEERLGLAFLYANAHVLGLAMRDRALCDHLRVCDLVFCDGYGVRVVARLLGTDPPPRLTPPDWIDDLFRALPPGTRLAFVGDTTEVSASAMRAAIANHPHLVEAAAIDGYRQLGPGGYRELIGQAEPDLVLVGMGTPLQESVVMGARSQGGPTLMAVGALFRYYSSFEARAPRVITDSGLEWLSRWAAHPVRFFSRYAIGLPRLLATAVHSRWVEGR